MSVQRPTETGRYLDAFGNTWRLWNDGLFAMLGNPDADPDNYGPWKQLVIAAQPDCEYEVTYTSMSAQSIDGHRLRRSSGMLPSLEAAKQWVDFSIDPIVHRRTKAVPAGEWERVDLEGMESR